jgi:hypothetical protein
VHHEEFAKLAEAVRRERHFKTGCGREELKNRFASSERR